MWICPKCGRSFKNTEQSHYCGKPPATIEEYIAAQPEEAQDYLRQINAAIKASIPEAKEKISWSMPTYWKGRNLIQFAASKRHIGLYPGPEAVEAFAGRLTEYTTSKGTIQLPYSKPLPLELIGEIANWCFKKYVNHCIQWFNHHRPVKQTPVNESNLITRCGKATDEQPNWNQVGI